VIFELAARDDDIWQKSIEKLEAMTGIIENNYFQEVSTDKLSYASIRGMLLTLDPHSYFLDPENFMVMRDEQKGKYSGLGIQIQKQEDRLVVISPIEGTPAWRLGILAGDVITQIDGESTKPISSIEAMQRLRGPKGTKVTITILRDGLDKPFDLTIVREEIPLYSVPYAFMLPGNIGYIFIRNFAETTAEEFEAKMKSLIKENPSSLILDLRANSGGPLFQSIELADEFLPRGALIVSIKGRNRYYDKDFRASLDHQYEGLPLVILINQGSASASEIVSGAIMDNDRGLIIGEDSWGKGLVQTIFPLSSNMALALTTAKYFTPSGRSIQRDFSHIEDYLLNKETPEEEREVRYTAKGRKVMGQGGIAPDYEVKTSFKNLTAELIIKGAFFTYGRKFVSHATPLSKKFILPGEKLNPPDGTEGKIQIGQSFFVDASVIQDFKDYVQANRLAADLSKFVEAEAEVKRELERELYSAIYGIEEGARIYRQNDPVILKAIEVMPEARKLIGQ
jgi:carboxyl-terminal processing protease